MQSKRSFFNGTLFRKNLVRSWPLWGGLSLVGALFPLYMLLELLQRRGVQISPNGFAEALYNSVTMFAPAFIAAYAALCAIVVWGYLYNARSVSMFHALPVDRTCLFVTNTLSGLAMLLIPFAIVGLLICLLAVCWGFFHLTAVLNTILAVILLAVTFFGIATLCAMLTGHIVVLPALYILANFLAPLLKALIVSLSEQFLIGVGIGTEDNSLILSPLFKIYSKFYSYYSHVPYNPDPEDYAPTLSGLWVVALYALAGLAMLALAWFLYKKRHSECAGDVVAFRWMQPIFRYGIALLSGLTLGRLLYELLWGELFQRGEYADVLPMFVCMALTGLVGYYAASMLIEKSKRVFRGSLRGVGVVCAGAAALMLLVSMDVFGIERRVPALDEIASVSLEDRNTVSGYFDPETNPEQVEAIRAFHQAIINDRDHIRSYSAGWHAEDAFHHNIWLTYHLKDGSTFRRAYDLWFTVDRAAQEGTYEDRLIRFYEDPQVRRGGFAIPEDASISEVEVYNYYSDERYYTSTSHRNAADARTIYDALLRDADEGNIPPTEVLTEDRGDGSLRIVLEYRTPMSPWDGSWSYGYKGVDLHPSMTNTVNTLLELEYVTEEQLVLWQLEYDEDTIDRYADYLIKNDPRAETVEIG